MDIKVDRICFIPDGKLCIDCRFLRLVDDPRQTLVQCRLFIEDLSSVYPLRGHKQVPHKNWQCIEAGKAMTELTITNKETAFLTLREGVMTRDEMKATMIETVERFITSLSPTEDCELMIMPVCIRTDRGSHLNLIIEGNGCTTDIVVDLARINQHINSMICACLKEEGLADDADIPIKLS